MAIDIYSLLNSEEFYEKLLEDLLRKRRFIELREKEIQIHLAWFLCNKHNICNITLESKYRYSFIDQKRHVRIFSDINKDLCKEQTTQAGGRQEIDIRIIEPSTWIELKVNPSTNGISDDYRRLFEENNYFEHEEHRFLIIFSKKDNINVPQHIENVKIKKLELEHKEDSLFIYILSKQ